VGAHRLLLLLLGLHVFQQLSSFFQGRESEYNPPKVKHVNAWGERIDEVTVAEGWKKLHDVAAEEVCSLFVSLLAFLSHLFSPFLFSGFGGDWIRKEIR
jgi:hypothetical protein